MKKISSLLLILVLISCKNHINENIINNQEKEIIKGYINKFPDNTQFSIAVIKNNKVDFLGYKIANDTIIEINNKDSVFEVGSITKLFTSTILTNLVNEDSIKLDDFITDYLPFELNPKEENAKKTTFRMLANHTSGLPNYPSNLDSVARRNPLNPYLEYDSLLLIEYLKNELILNSIPGDNYEYSNLGFGILGYLLEIKTGKSYEELLKKYVFQKYDMGISTTNQKIVQNYLVKGQNEKGEIVPNWDLNIHRATGDVLSSTNDLANFVIANFTNDSILSFQRQKTFDDHSNNVALGWNMIRFCGFTPFYWYFHDGGTLGYRSSIYMDTKAKSAVIVLSNFTAFHELSGNISRIAKELLRHQYKFNEINSDCYCEAPFIEQAIEKGWGTWINDSISQIDNSENSIIGVWQQKLPNRINIRTFTPDNKAQSDFYNDDEIDVWGYYDIKGDTVIFKDMGGVGCDFEGVYKFNIANDTLRFQLLKDDECDGRVRGMTGNWLRVKNK